MIIFKVDDSTASSFIEQVHVYQSVYLNTSPKFWKLLFFLGHATILVHGILSKFRKSSRVGLTNADPSCKPEFNLDFRLYLFRRVNSWTTNMDALRNYVKARRWVHKFVSLEFDIKQKLHKIPDVELVWIVGQVLEAVISMQIPAIARFHKVRAHNLKRVYFGEHIIRRSSFGAYDVSSSWQGSQSKDLNKWHIHTNSALHVTSTCV